MDEQPFAFQQTVRDLFFADADIVLQAPTGAGKTRAASEPALIGFDRDLTDQSADFPPRIFYLAPMRTLVRDIHDTLQSFADEHGWEKEWHPHIQTGEQPDDPTFSHKLIIATVDQVLASFLNIPYGLPSRFDNLNAGALIGSYFIFDEVHLYPRDEMLLTVLAMLKMLKGISRFTLMSATLSRPFLEAIARELGAEILTENVAGTQFADVKSVATQARTWYAQTGQLTAEVVKQLRGDRTLCICNTVDRAQALYLAVKSLLPDVEIVLLHSRFYTPDRRQIEDRLLNAETGFEKSHNIIVIATQVVEVGLDISANVLITECAPAASLIQRAGRCARRADQTGQVYVFQPLDEEGEVNYAPYIEDGFEEVCLKTWSALTSDTFNGHVLHFADEQRLVDQAHGEADRKFLTELGDNINSRIASICEMIRQPDYGKVSMLIRKSTSVPLYITAADVPKSDPSLTDKPLAHESFSVSKGRLYYFYKQLTEEQADLPFYLAGSSGEAVATEDDDAQTDQTYRWNLLRNEQEIYGQRWFAVHQTAISYTTLLGLHFAPSNQPAPPSPPKGTSGRNQPIAYAAERYQDHVGGLLSAFNYLYQHNDPNEAHTPLRQETIFPLRRLCAQYGLDPDLAERLLRLTLALHDVGKLNRRWQAWVSAWQSRYEQVFEERCPVLNHVPLARWDDDRTKELKSKMGTLAQPPRGTHAVESAEACLPIIDAATDGDEFWNTVIVSAIMHHHTPRADSCGEFKLDNQVDAALRDVFTQYEFADEADRWLPLFQRDFQKNSPILKEYTKDVLPDYQEGWRATLMYFLFVRVLRLADQRASKYHARFKTVR